MSNCNHLSLKNILHRAEYDAQRLALQHDFDAMFKERIHEEYRMNPPPTFAAPTELPIE